jgi:hypothetical protein
MAMTVRLMKFFLFALSLFSFSRVSGQAQSCPVNSNFSQGNLTNWSAYTGNNKLGNGQLSIKETYSETAPFPGGTVGVVSIPEYQLPSVSGIKIISTSYADAFGSFQTIPKINGYQYAASVMLGSTSISRNNSGGGVQGGYTRGISYKINVPTSASARPYTMTYAYAMVLENGAHNSEQQPLISATLSKGDSVIACASPSYYLPTQNNASQGGGGATLDSATAYRNGFSPSPTASPNPSQNGGALLHDVWTKGWTEVTFDLSPFRGQQVTLTFEADNCVPGGHFSYAYIALRNTCDGLEISGPAVACINGSLLYSRPALGGASYEWQVPSDWTILGGSDGNILSVQVGNAPGKIIAHEVNGCADLRDTIDVVTSPPTIAGALSGDNRVCAENNTNPLVLNGQRGGVLQWISSTDNGITWTGIPNGTALYTAQNLTATTLFRALVQNGESCAIDTSGGATILVDPKSVGGIIDPALKNICIGQNQDATLTLNGSVGSVLNWQSSPDGASWANVSPVYQGKVFGIIGLNTPTQYRAILKSGVCPQDISTVSKVNIINTRFPVATAHPADTAICYGDSAQLNAFITIGTNYSWTNTNPLAGSSNGVIPSTPFDFSAVVSPRTTTDYMLNIVNAGCPNSLKDTFHVFVHNQIIVSAGRDTSVVMNQPLQLEAVSSDTAEDLYVWKPNTGLDNPFVSNPVATLGRGIDSVRYTVRATANSGCYGEAQKLVKVYKTLPDIFVPNAFTPGKGSNGVLRPIPVGISTLQYFRVFSRWGQLVYSTSVIGQGWDGILNGRLQETGSFVWMVQGTDYTGKPVFRKGTAVLVR